MNIQIRAKVFDNSQNASDCRKLGLVKKKNPGGIRPQTPLLSGGGIDSHIIN